MTSSILPSPASPVRQRCGCNGVGVISNNRGGGDDGVDNSGSSSNSSNSNKNISSSSAAAIGVFGTPRKRAEDQPAPLVPMVFNSLRL
ncbi:hypothetical protein PoB_001210700 [Plakobranchus ocellatus]|uniref:Uncharacterized protein n=1 Tax=Plakobranchus ocellatus TaxID=259542 RepID=A0AAV3YT18_9GAST|nr:hypothetical protein PoB_001210700 [Plakobranchus ocellatus]